MTSPLRVVVAMPEAPDPFGNPAARWYYVLLKGLAERGHDIRAFAAYTRTAYAEAARTHLAATGVRLEFFPYPDRRGWWQRKWATARRPYSYFLHPGLSASVARALKHGYDVLHLEQMWTGYLGLHIPRALLSVHHLTYLDLLNARPHSSRAFFEQFLMGRTERRMLARFREIRATTNRLALEIGRVNPTARVTTIPIALDLALYPVQPRQDDGRTVGFIGSMHWHIGAAAAERLVTRIWPYVRTKVPTARLLVAGWAADRVLGRYKGNDGVTILGDVPDARRDFFERVSVFAYPLTQGSGMKVKILEAMAYGVPVVGTREGLEGVVEVSRGEVLVADNDEAFAQSIVYLLKDREARQRLSAAGRKLVESHFSPAATIPQVEQLYSTVLNGGIPAGRTQ